MYIHFNRAVHELLAEAIAAEEILHDRQKAENKLCYAAGFVSRFHGGMFPDDGILVLPRDFETRPELVAVIVNFTGGQQVVFSDNFISPAMTAQVNARHSQR